MKIRQEFLCYALGRIRQRHNLSPGGARDTTTTDKAFTNGFDGIEMSAIPTGKWAARRQTCGFSQLAKIPPTICGQLIWGECILAIAQRTAGAAWPERFSPMNPR
jgi:hypothetical protein